MSELQETIMRQNINSENLKVVSCTLNDLLETNFKAIPEAELKGQLIIPEYQRPYVWSEKQINRLLNDLIEFQADKSSDKPLYYLGSIILHKDGGESKNY